jgi:hypothetical protein
MPRSGVSANSVETPGFRVFVMIEAVKRAGANTDIRGGRLATPSQCCRICPTRDYIARLRSRRRLTSTDIDGDLASFADRIV